MWKEIGSHRTYNKFAQLDDRQVIVVSESEKCYYLTLSTALGGRFIQPGRDNKVALMVDFERGIFCLESYNELEHVKPYKLADTDHHARVSCQGFIRKYRTQLRLFPGRVFTGHFDGGKFIVDPSQAVEIIGKTGAFKEV